MVDATALRVGLEASGLSVIELWIRYFGLGGTRTPSDLRSYLDGRDTVMTMGQHDIIVHALNERLVEVDPERAVPYARA